jgi:hypothetical protein
MRNIITFLAFSILGIVNLNAQCLSANYGQWPSSSFTPSCASSCNIQNITTVGWAGEYSVVNVIAGNTYTFRSSVSNDYITIANSGGTSALSFGTGGTTGRTWTATFTGTVRFYTHTNASCGNSTINRTKSVCCVSNAPPPVTNDLCSGAINLTCGQTVTVNTTGANTDAAGSNFCGTSISTRGVWYKITGNGQQMTVSTCGGSTDSKLMVFSGNCGSLVCVGGNDDNGAACSGLAASVSWNSVNGTTYYILAATFSNTGSFPLNISCTQAQNPCSNITSLNCNSSVSYSTGGGSGIWDNLGPYATPGKERVFSFTPSISGTHTINLSNNEFFVDLFIKTGSCSSSGWTYLSDFASGSYSYSLNLIAGTTYYILLDDENTNSSSGNIGISCPVPCNGSSLDASYSNLAQISSTTQGACDDCILRSSQDRIYRWDVSCAATYTVSMCGSSFDTYLYLTTGACSGNILASNDDACGLQSQFTVTLNPGTYYLIVEGFSQTSAGSFNINISSPAPQISASSSNVSCFGANNGSISVNGASGLLYSIDGGVTFNPSNVFTNLGAGLYTVIAKNCLNQNSNTLAVVISQPAALDAAAVSGSIACFGGSTTVSVSASGGSAPYSGTGSYTVTAGTYSYSVTDANGCSDMVTLTVTEPALLTASSLSGNIACFGGNTTVNVSAGGGTQPYSGTGIFTVGAGTYNYLVTDTNGCSANTSITVSQPTELIAAYTATDILCFGGSSAVEISASGGTQPYSGTGNYFVGAGNYSYTVTDGNGCTDDVSFSLSQPAQLTVSAGNDQVVYYGYAPLSCADIDASSNGGSGTVSYEWFDDNGNSIGTGVSINVCPSSSQSYHVVATDANGCTAISSVNICVIDVECRAGNSHIVKVEMCQIPPGNPNNAHTICVDASAVPAHLAIGCTLGSCAEAGSCNNAMRPAQNVNNSYSNKNIAMTDLNINIFPNPTSSVTTLSIESSMSDNFQIRIFDALGRQVKIIFVGNQQSTTIMIPMTELPSGNYTLQVLGEKTGFIAKSIIKS